MARDATATREQLVAAAAHLFARHGIEEVALRDVGVLAGQRNASAVQYHFGGRWDLVAAVLSRHHDTVTGWVPAVGTSSLDGLVTGLIGLLRPELATPGGRDFLRISFELISRHPDRWRSQPHVHTGFDALVQRAGELLTHLPPDTARARGVAMAQFVSHQMSERARAIDSGTDMPAEGDFADDLAAMALGLIRAPAATTPTKAGAPGAGASRRRPTTTKEKAR